MKTQKGFTLVELMIAGVIGIFLMASLMNLFITTNRSITLSEALSQNQESGRFALDYMTKFIRQAGYSADFTAAAPPVLINTPATPCTVADACSANNPSNANGDRLAIPYVSDVGGTIKSCSGTDIVGQQSIANVFWVSNTAGSENELRCRTYDYLNNTWIDTAAVSIVANVETFEFQLGLAELEDDRNAARYVNMDTIINDDGSVIIPLSFVRSIRIALLTTSQDSLDANKVQTNAGSRKYVVLDGTMITTEDDDSYLRQVFSNTIELPNMIESAHLN